MLLEIILILLIIGAFGGGAFYVAGSSLLYILGAILIIGLIFRVFSRNQTPLL